MPNCVKCGRDTELHVFGVAICADCERLEMDDCVERSRLIHSFRASARQWAELSAQLLNVADGTDDLFHAAWMRLNHASDECERRELELREHIRHHGCSQLSIDDPDEMAR